MPFTSDRYGYTVAHPPSWTATPATRAWDYQRSPASQFEGSDQIGGSSAYVLSSAGYLISFSAFAVDVRAGTSAIQQTDLLQALLGTVEFQP